MSRILIPSMSPACFSWLYTFLSSGLGVGSPLGWLCASMRAYVLFVTAVLKTLRGCTRLAFSVPMVMISRAMTRIFVFMWKAMKISLSAFLMSCSCWYMSWAVTTLGASVLLYLWTMQLMKDGILCHLFEFLL